MSNIKEFEIKLDINKENINDIRKRIIYYFQSQGFKLTELNDKNISFHKKPILTDQLIYNPLKLKSKINISITGNEIHTIFLIDTKSLFITDEFYELWEKFINNYKNYTLNGISFLEKNKIDYKNYKKNNSPFIYGYLSYLLIILFIAGISSLIFGGFMKIIKNFFGENVVILIIFLLVFILLIQDLIKKYEKKN